MINFYDIIKEETKKHNTNRPNINNWRLWIWKNKLII